MKRRVSWWMLLEKGQRHAIKASLGTEQIPYSCAVSAPASLGKRDHSSQACSSPERGEKAILFSSAHLHNGGGTLNSWKASLRDEADSQSHDYWTATDYAEVGKMSPEPCHTHEQNILELAVNVSPSSQLSLNSRKPQGPRQTPKR